MKLFKSHTFTWQQVEIFKLALLAIGIAIGAYWHEFFDNYLFLLIMIGVVAGAYIAYISLRDKEPILEKQAREKAEHKKRILDFLENQSQLTNNDVERLLGVSDATATRYLDELEKEGRVRQIGATGKNVRYEKVS